LNAGPSPASWPCPQALGGLADEYALATDRARSRRLLILPALFDEGNRLRRFTVEVMRALDRAGVDSFLPDLPGTNESLRPLEEQTVSAWRDAAEAAARHFGATQVLGIRGGCLFTPPGPPALHYAPAKAATILRQMLRARILAAREAGREENREALVEAAQAQGIELVGYRLGAAFFREFEVLTPAFEGVTIAQDQVGGAGLWLRAEPGESAEQAAALAAAVASAMAP
jgi:hypothetical protein